MIRITKYSTKREALEACREHWQWLAENPGKDKDDWPELCPSIRDDCYCCEYMGYRPRVEWKLNCRKCPLTGYAWQPDKWPACTQEGSVYRHWSDKMEDLWERETEISREDILDQIALYAQKMVEACDKALSDLGA